MPHSLILWGYDLDAQLTDLDVGAFTPGSSGDFDLRVANQSTHYTATGVTVEATGAAATNLLFSLDGENFAATAELGDLPAQAMSPGVTVRITVPEAAAGVHTCQLTATAADWAATTAPTV